MLRKEIRLELTLERLEWDLGVPVGKPSEMLWQRDEQSWQYGEIVLFAKNIFGFFSIKKSSLLRNISKLFFFKELPSAKFHYGSQS
jgi:hypothetical protein